MKAADVYIDWSLSEWCSNDIITMINNARIDTIKECAERATTETEHDYHGNGEGYEYSVVDKQSILKLIDEIK